MLISVRYKVLILLKCELSVAFEQNILIRPWPPSSAGRESVISVQVADQQNSPLKDFCDTCFRVDSVKVKVLLLLIQ